MSDVKSIVSALGRRQIAEKVVRTDSAVGNAIADGRFPASWYPVVREMCVERGIDCPLDAFNWRNWPLPPVQDEAGAA